MVASNERGRALELVVAEDVFALAEKSGLSVRFTERAKIQNMRQKAYFEELDGETKDNFKSCSETFNKWLLQQEWIGNSKELVIDRIPDNEAKENVEVTDLRLYFLSKEGKKFQKDFSIKNNSDSLCHPRLPSLPESCGIKDETISGEYRKKYRAVWESFGKRLKSLDKAPLTFSELDSKNEDFRVDWLYSPLQKLAVEFLSRYCNDKGAAEALFTYLTGKGDYYVVKNSKTRIEIKHFSSIPKPTSFKITYPFMSKSYFLLEFDNGWKIRVRIHNASSRLFKKDGSINATEKEDPICQNIEKVIKIEKILKN